LKKNNMCYDYINLSENTKLYIKCYTNKKMILNEKTASTSINGGLNDILVW